MRQVFEQPSFEFELSSSQASELLMSPSPQMGEQTDGLEELHVNPYSIKQLEEQPSFGVRLLSSHCSVVGSLFPFPQTD